MLCAQEQFIAPANYCHFLVAADVLIAIRVASEIN
jgi:hypothetical protein